MSDDLSALEMEEALAMQGVTDASALGRESSERLMRELFSGQSDPHQTEPEVVDLTGCPCGGDACEHSHEDHKHAPQPAADPQEDLQTRLSLAYEAFTTETPDVPEDDGDHQSNRPRKKRKIQRKVPAARAKQWG
jgi:hypothetical protein